MLGIQVLLGFFFLLGLLATTASTLTSDGGAAMPGNALTRFVGITVMLVFGTILALTYL